MLCCQPGSSISEGLLQGVVASSSSLATSLERIGSSDSSAVVAAAL
jgi:hypothetical protein